MSRGRFIGLAVGLTLRDLLNIYFDASPFVYDTSALLARERHSAISAGLAISEGITYEWIYLIRPLPNS